MDLLSSNDILTLYDLYINNNNQNEKYKPLFFNFDYFKKLYFSLINSNKTLPRYEEHMNNYIKIFVNCGKIWFYCRINKKERIGYSQILYDSNEKIGEYPNINKMILGIKYIIKRCRKYRVNNLELTDKYIIEGNIFLMDIYILKYGEPYFIKKLGFETEESRINNDNKLKIKKVKMNDIKWEKIFLKIRNKKELDDIIDKYNSCKNNNILMTDFLQSFDKNTYYSWGPIVNYLFRKLKLDLLPFLYVKKIKKKIIHYKNKNHLI